jgi:hypothetical protein
MNFDVRGLSERQDFKKAKKKLIARKASDKGVDIIVLHWNGGWNTKMERIITVDLPNFFLVATYAPTAVRKHRASSQEFYDILQGAVYSSKMKIGLCCIL